MTATSVKSQLGNLGMAIFDEAYGLWQLLEPVLLLKKRVRCARHIYTYPHEVISIMRRTKLSPVSCFMQQ